MDSKVVIAANANFLSPLRDAAFCRQLPCLHLLLRAKTAISVSGSGRCGGFYFPKRNDASRVVRRFSNNTLMTNSTPSKSGVYTVGDFMTKKEKLQVVKPSTTVDEALETLVENRITGFPVIDDDWKLEALLYVLQGYAPKWQVGLVSDYDLLALDTISGTGLAEASMFPEVDSTWKVFNELQKLLSKTNGKLVADVMTQAPVVVRETTNLDDAARLLLETRYRRLPVVDSDGKLVGIITRGNVIRAALQIKRATEKGSQ